MFGRRVLPRVGADPYRDVRVCVCVCVCVCVQGFGLMLNVAATDGVKQISVLASMSQRPRDPGDMRLLAVRIARGIAITSCADAPVVLRGVVSLCSMMMAVRSTTFCATRGCTHMLFPCPSASLLTRCLAL